MLSAIVNLSISTITFAGLIAALAHSVFRYPHIWRYLEVRHRSRRQLGERRTKRRRAKREGEGSS